VKIKRIRQVGTEMGARKAACPGSGGKGIGSFGKLRRYE